MEDKIYERVLDSSIQSNFVAKLKLVMRFIKGITHQFKVTHQDLIDAGVYLRNRYD
jgi:hypothetical protein